LSRIDREPVFVLHRRAWRDTSLIVEFFSAHHGRVAGVARAARRSKSAFFGLTEPFRLLEASWVRRGEMFTLVALDPVGKARRLTGRAMWCGLYANELLLRLTPRDDPEPELFDAYAKLLPELPNAARQGNALRRFELALLQTLGVAPELSVVQGGAEEVLPDARYDVDPIAGPLPAISQRSGVRGSVLLALASGDDLAADDEIAARHLMRKLIERQLDGRKLNTPAFFRENQS